MKENQPGFSATNYKPLVSIVTPSYNAMPYIEETIKSVLNQNYPYFEHIVFDGESNDGTIDVLKSYSHLDWISEKDSGQSNALNKGFKKAKGEIIGWLNADDTYEPGAIDRAVDFLMNHSEIDLVFTDLNIINESGKVIGFSKGDNFDLMRLLTFNMIKQPTLFMRRKVLEELNGLNENYHFVMDHEFWLRAGIKAFRFHYLPNTIFANFRLIAGTKTFESATAFHEEWYVVLKEVLQTQSFLFLNEKAKQKMLKATESNIYTSRMLQSMDRNDRRGLLNNFAIAIRNDFSLILNRGIWRFLFLGLSGLKYDRLSRYK